MTSLLIDLDVTCASLGHSEGNTYNAEPDALQNLKHLIWILRRDGDTHEYRRHLGRSKVLETDLLPMLMTFSKEQELSDVLLRLLVNLTNPALLLYREKLPTDGPGRGFYLEIVEHLQGYKQAMASQGVWAALSMRIQEALEIDWAERSEDTGLLIERILVLARNVLQVPSSPDVERRADNDASLHDQVLWAFHRSGLLEIVLYIASSEHENQYHLHALEIICLMFREQNVATLADASLQRSTTEKEQDERELVTARQTEKAKVLGTRRLPPSSRHSRFVGTYVLKDVKSISDNDVICHKVIDKAEDLDFNAQKPRQRRPKNKLIIAGESCERRSAVSVRLFLREFCLEMLASAYNTITREVHRALNNMTNVSDESYLLWAVRFFMEFNRLNDFKLQYVSETLNNSWFHWVLNCSEKFMDMQMTDKQQIRLWARRLHLAVQTYREFLMSLQALNKCSDEQARILSRSLQGTIFYVLEYRETIIHLLLSYDEIKNTKAFLRDLIETGHIFCKMLEKYCKSQGVSGAILVQQKMKQRKAKKSVPKKPPKMSREDRWALMAPQISAVLTGDGAEIPSDVIPFDAASDKENDEQKVDCMKRLQRLLAKESYEEAIALIRAAREVWPEHDNFGASGLPPEEELMALEEIFMAQIDGSDIDEDENGGGPGTPAESDDDSADSEENEEEESQMITETNFKFEDFEMRFANPKIVRACTLLLADWKLLPPKTVTAAVTLLHRVAWSCKVPGMLFQAALFRIFQSVLNAPREIRHEELRKLAVYIVRQFTKVAEMNPKTFAELLFWKTSRDACNLETNYENDPQKRVRGAWSEEEEDELRRLFEENQSLPENEQDVIDWLCENLIATRTRREVMRKLKDLGLTFTRPTRKSSALANPKGPWSRDQDAQLSELYEQHRAEEDALAKLCEALPDRKKPAIIRRLITLGLIANKEEIVPLKKTKTKSAGVDAGQKPRKPKKKLDQDKQTKAPKRVIAVKKLNRGNIRNLLQQLDDMDGGIEWLYESLRDAAEDLAGDEAAGDEDGIPLVPLLADQSAALENSSFQHLLKELGIQEPIAEMEIYWRIPGKFTGNDLNVRVQILEGNDRDSDSGGEGNLETSHLVEEMQLDDVDSLSDSDGGSSANESASSNELNTSSTKYTSITPNNDEEEEETRVVKQVKKPKKQKINRLLIDDDSSNDEGNDKTVENIMEESTAADDSVSERDGNITERDTSLSNTTIDTVKGNLSPTNYRDNSEEISSLLNVDSDSNDEGEVTVIAKNGEQRNKRLRSSSEEEQEKTVHENSRRSLKKHRRIISSDEDSD